MSGTNPSKPCLFTVGHSDHDTPAFLELLARHGITVVADVRSHPYSRIHAQFNRETLDELLQRAGIRYIFMGHELGARRTEREAYRGRQACYDLIARLPAFRAGLDRLRLGVASERLTLLCAEKDPITCHRTILVCRHLRADPLDIRHILEDGSTESTDQAETRLLDAVGLPSEDLFRTRAALVEEAYDAQSRRIAYTESDTLPVAKGVSA